ncbi:hypothetical protein QQ045_015845 [Rhodiola kirilowii]
MEGFYIDELDEFGLQVDEDPIDEFLNDEDIERLLEIETELMGIDSSTNQVSTNDEEAHREAELLINEHNSVTDLLLMGAEALEEQNWLKASKVISKLYEVLDSTKQGEHENAFDRLALFFTKGLHQKLDTYDPRKPLFHEEEEEEESTIFGKGNTMSAFQMLQELTPYVKFAHFTANQAIFEATKDEQEIHIIDFDIMDGIQWPPLMIDLSLRQNASLKITATTTSATNTAHQTGRRLKEFADSVNLPFTFNHFVMTKEEDFNIITNQTGYIRSKVVANCIVNQFYMPQKNSSQVAIFLNGVKKLVPKIIVLVEEELHSFSIKNNTSSSSKSFVELFCEALHHYNVIDESLMSSFVNEYTMGIRMVENELLGVKIISSLRHIRSGEVEKEILKEFKQVRFSFGNVSQAKFLVALFKGGYWVQNEHGRLALCWNSKPLTVVSIWAPK